MHSINRVAWFGCLLAGAVSTAAAQSNVERAFTTTSPTCEGVQWSDRALQRFPTIAEACQAVEEREGRTYVRFQGTVKRNRRGEEIVMDFKDGGEVTLTPPEDAQVYFNDRATPVARLRPGDELTFFVAEDRLAAHFPETKTATARFVVVPIAPSSGAVAEDSSERMASLPATSGPLPWLALAGLVAFGAGFGSLLLRRISQR